MTDEDLNNKIREAVHDWLNLEIDDEKVGIKYEGHLYTDQDIIYQEVEPEAIEMVLKDNNFIEQLKTYDPDETAYNPDKKRWDFSKKTFEDEIWLYLGEHGISPFYEDDDDDEEWNIDEMIVKAVHSWLTIFDDMAGLTYEGHIITDQNVLWDEIEPEVIDTVFKDKKLIDKLKDIDQNGEYSKEPYEIFNFEVWDYLKTELGIRPVDAYEYKNGAYEI